MKEIPKDKIKVATQGLQAIAHELRLSILCHLMKKPMCVQELIKATGASQSNLSQHLSKMRLLGVLNNKKKGQQVYYSIVDPRINEIVHVLRKIYCPRRR